jgi:biopolymer transport protein ExbB
MQQDASQTPAAAQPAVVPGSGGNAAAMSQMGFHDLIQNFDALGWIVFVTLCVMSLSSIYFIVANFLRNSMIARAWRK